MLNGLVAPVVFNRVWEYGLTLAVVPLLLLGVSQGRDSWLTRRYHPVFASLMLVALLLVLSKALGLMLGLASREPSTALLALAVVTGVGWVAAARPWALATALLAGTVVVAVQAASSSLAMERTFFGSYRVEADHQTHTPRARHHHARDAVHRPCTQGHAHHLLRRRRPPRGRLRHDDTRPSRRIGLGTGTVAAYGRDGQEMTFFEIDKAIAEMARDTRLFTYLEDSPADIDIRVGDGRLLVADEPEAAYDLLVLDAFSSDSIRSISSRGRPCVSMPRGWHPVAVLSFTSATASSISSQCLQRRRTT